MCPQTNNSKEEHSKGKKPNVKDPRHIITPDAFKVDDDLLGLPLATPKRRAFAMLLDLLLIQQLSQINSVILGLAIAVVLFMLSSSKGRKTVGSARKITFKLLALTLFLYLIVTESWQYLQTQEFTLFNPDTQNQTVAEEATAKPDNKLSNLPLAEQLSIANEQIEELKAENRVLKADEGSDLMDMFEAIAKKFGYGFGWAGVYFTLFCYLLNGQTPGKFLLRIKVIQLDGRKLTIWNSFGRYGGYAASIVTGLSGFLQILWDPNRQGLHDKVASTVVIKV